MQNKLNNPHDIGLPPSRLPGWVQWGAIGIFVFLVVISGFWALTEHWRRATFALGMGMLWLAIVRASCDSTKVGIFAVRSRRFDIGFSLVLGAAMTWLAVSVDALGS